MNCFYLKFDFFSSIGFLCKNVIFVVKKYNFCYIKTESLYQIEFYM